jgi:hypothetical protein
MGAQGVLADIAGVVRIAKAASVGVTGNVPRIARAELALAAVADLVEAATESAAELRRLRSAMSTTYAAAANGADHDRLLARIEKERDAYEEGFSGDRLDAALLPFQSEAES